MFRFVILFFGGLLVTFGSRSLDLAGAGALGCLTLAFVAALGWRKELQLGEHVSLPQSLSVAPTVSEERGFYGPIVVAHWYSTGHSCVMHFSSSKVYHVCNKCTFTFSASLTMVVSFFINL